MSNWCYMLHMCCISQEIWSTGAELQLRLVSEGGGGVENMNKNNQITLGSKNLHQLMNLRKRVEEAHAYDLHDHLEVSGHLSKSGRRGLQSNRVF